MIILKSRAAGLSFDIDHSNPDSSVTSTKASAISRRQLLRGDISGASAPIRPPWSVAEEIFLAACDRCSDCIYACAEGVIRFGAGGFPEMDFSANGCSLCGECLIACGGKALRGDTERDRPWHSTVVEIGDSCLAKNGVVCRSCGEACGERAIRFPPRVGGVAEPRLERALCSGCGSCIGVCPVQAVSLVQAPPPTARLRAAEPGRA